jgi:hypothetical protein
MSSDYDIYSNEKSFTFNAPSGFMDMVRDIVYDRTKGKNFFNSSVQDKEDEVSVIAEIIEQSMNRSYKIGYTLGLADGQKYNKNGNK